MVAIRAAAAGAALKGSWETRCFHSQLSEPSQAAWGLLLKPGEVMMLQNHRMTEW